MTTPEQKSEPPAWAVELAEKLGREIWICHGFRIDTISCAALIAEYFVAGPDVEEMEALEQKATASPWKSRDSVVSAMNEKAYNYICRMFSTEAGIGCTSYAPDVPESMANAAFIAASRSFIPAAIRTIRAQAS